MRGTGLGATLNYSYLWLALRARGQHALRSTTTSIGRCHSTAVYEHKLMHAGAGSGRILIINVAIAVY